jgi:hypothetical protein
MHTKFCSEDLKGRDILGDLGMVETAILKLLLRKYVVKCDLD